MAATTAKRRIWLWPVALLTASAVAISLIAYAIDFHNATGVLRPRLTRLRSGPWS